MSAPGDPSEPLRVAVVGSGPAGFYAAEALLGHPELAVEVDMIDRLPTPFGLVRAGVAPDHPKIKNVIKRYEKTAGHEAYRFFGHVTVGRDVGADELAGLYHAVVWAYGAGADRRLGIPGEDLPGSHAATEFVAWYNGHPDFADREFNLDCERVVVIGNGNVAADVARMLVLPREELEVTDTAPYAIDALAGSSVREVLILGRRGPAQAAFTNPEVRELGELTDADVVVDPAAVVADETTTAFLDSDAADATNRKNLESLTGFAEREPTGKPKRVELRFLRTPLEIQGDGRVERIVVGVNELHRDDSGAVRARDHRGDRDARMRHGPALDRLPRNRHRRRSLRRRRRRHPERARPGARRGRRTAPRPLRRRLDQARADRRDRHQQEGRAGDDRDAARGRRRRSASRSRGRRLRRAAEAPGRARRSISSSSTAGGRSTRSSSSAGPTPAGRGSS